MVELGSGLAFLGWILVAMDVSVQVQVSNLQERLDRIGRLPQEVLEDGSQAIYDFLVEYHSQMDWKGSDWFAGSRSGEFAKSVVQGWQPPRQSGNSVEIRNTFGLLAWKVRGGTITPQRATHLTIPVISESRGLSVAEFSSATGQKLFRAGQALCRKVGQKVEAVYALSLGVRQRPWPDAMPSNQELRRVAQRAAHTIFLKVSR